jgi:hypothetical protein
MKRQHRMGILVLAGVLMAGAAGAEEAPMTMNQNPCRQDAERLCAGIQPGNGALRACLKQHESEVSAPCKTHISQMKEKMKEKRVEIQAACKADTDQFCKDVTPGEGREMACLHAYNDKISAGCKDVLTKHRGMKK